MTARDTPTPTKENPTMPENPYRGRQAAYSSAFVWDEGFARITMPCSPGGRAARSLVGRR